jgi:tRNA 2-thiouridine synthesizing protein A
MTFVKVKLKLERIDKGDQLEILLTEGEPLRNVPKSAAEQGYKILSIEPQEKGHYQVVIEK